MISRLALCILLTALAGCAGPVDMSGSTAPNPLPAADYLETARRGGQVYQVVAEDSLLLIRVGRDGPARRLGHDHAVASEHLAGYIELADERDGSRADIAFPVVELVVDKAAYRERLGLDTAPSEDDVAGTRANMFKVLDPGQYPWVSASARVASIREEDLQLAVSVTLHGATAEFLLPVRLELRDDTLRAAGELTIRHSDFGLQPFSAAGLLRVADELEVQFDIQARRKS